MSTRDRDLIYDFSSTLFKVMIVSEVCLNREEKECKIKLLVTIIFRLGKKSQQTRLRKNNVTGNNSGECGFPEAQRQEVLKK